MGQVAPQSKAVTEKIDAILGIVVKMATLGTFCATLTGFIVLGQYTIQNNIPFDVTAFPVSFAVTAAIIGTFVVIGTAGIIAYPIFGMTQPPSTLSETLEPRKARRFVERLRLFLVLDVPLRVLTLSFVIGTNEQPWNLWALVALLAALEISFVYKSETTILRTMSALGGDVSLGDWIRKLRRYSFTWILVTRGFFAVFLCLPFALVLFWGDSALESLFPGRRYLVALLAIAIVAYEIIVHHTFDPLNRLHKYYLGTIFLALLLFVLWEPPLAASVGRVALSMTKNGGGIRANIGLAGTACERLDSKLKPRNLGCSNIAVSVWLKDAGHIYFTFPDEPDSAPKIAIRREEALVEEDGVVVGGKTVVPRK